MKNKFAQEALLSLLISFLANSSDIIELFAYVDEEKILPNKSLVVQILSKPHKSPPPIQTEMHLQLLLLKFFLASR